MLVLLEEKGGRITAITGGGKLISIYLHLLKHEKGEGG